MTERKRRMWKWIKRRINKCGVKQAKEWLPILFRWLWWKVYLTLKDRMWSKIRNAPIPNKKGEQIRNEKQTKFARGSRQHENNLQQQYPFPTSNCDNNHQIIMLIIKFLIVIILVTELLDNISHIRDISNSDWDTIASSMTDFGTMTKRILVKNLPCSFLRVL